MRFAKYHGTRNDFVLVEDLEATLRLPQDLVAAVCDRHAGIGADGLIRVVRGDASGGAGADFFMDYHNADGEVAEMCGNGIRCLGKYVYDRGLTTATEIDVDSRDGIKHLTLHPVDGVVEQVTVDMGTPALRLGEIPMRGDPASTFLSQPYEVAGRTYLASAVSMGNPHLVLFLEPGDDLEGLDVAALGSLVERRDEFPNRTNVEFVQMVDDSIHMRVWERGSGQTLACGTGACAVMVASSLAGLTGREADVLLPGGRLHVRWGTDDRVLMTGPATWVADGELSEAWIAQATAGSLAGAGGSR